MTPNTKRVSKSAKLNRADALRLLSESNEKLKDKKSYLLQLDTH